MGSEIQRKGSKVLLCFWQCGHVSEDLGVEEEKKRNESLPMTENSSRKQTSCIITCTGPETAPGQKSQPTAGVKVPPELHHLPRGAAMTRGTEELQV